MPLNASGGCRPEFSAHSKRLEQMQECPLLAITAQQTHFKRALGKRCCLYLDKNL